MRKLGITKLRVLLIIALVLVYFQGALQDNINVVIVEPRNGHGVVCPTEEYMVRGSHSTW